MRLSNLADYAVVTMHAAARHCGSRGVGAARLHATLLAEETGVPHVVDPLGGSYYVESLTHSIAAEAWKLIEQVEELGGMTKAVSAGMPKLHIEESATRRQARAGSARQLSCGR